jgi:segregation and condensation protein B
VGRPGLYATTRQFLNDLSLTTLQDLPMLEDADAQAESLAQKVIEFEGDHPELASSEDIQDVVIDVVDTSEVSADNPSDVKPNDNI